MTSEQSVEEWARSAQFSRPVRWGEVEAGILAREPAKGEDLPVGMWVPVVFSRIGIVAFVTVLFASSVVGLALVALGSLGDGTEWDWVTPAKAAFAVAVLGEVIFFRSWVKTGRHAVVNIPVSALTALAAVVAYIVLKSAADESGTSWLRVVVIIAAVSAIMLVALELTSTPEGGDKSKDPPRRGPRSSRKRDNYLDARVRVLAILQKRGLVRLDEVDGKRLTEMPLGYWDELDGVDEKEWRRILEYRHVGWREFDESDRRPWPPAG